MAYMYTNCLFFTCRSLYLQEMTIKEHKNQIKGLKLSEAACLILLGFSGKIYRNIMILMFVHMMQVFLLLKKKKKKAKGVNCHAQWSSCYS